MSLQDELNELRAVLQAVIDYVGNPQVTTQLQANKERAEKAKTEGAAVAAEQAPDEPAKDPQT